MKTKMQITLSREEIGKILADYVQKSLLATPPLFADAKHVGESLMDITLETLSRDKAEITVVPRQFSIGAAARSTYGSGTGNPYPQGGGTISAANDDSITATTNEGDHTMATAKEVPTTPTVETKTPEEKAESIPDAKKFRGLDAITETNK